MDDIIVAISTALAKGAISIIRLSGSGSIELVNKCFKGKDLTKAESHTINYGFIIDNDKIIDQVLVSVMKAPKTYTKEDVVEINCHGGIAATNKILELMILNGANFIKVNIISNPILYLYFISPYDIMSFNAFLCVINFK